MSSGFKHTVCVTDHFHRKIKSLDKTTQKRVQDRIEELAKDYRKGKPLQGPLKNFWADRVGRYRIIYGMPKPCIIELYSVEHRESAYQHVRNRVKP